MPLDEKIDDFCKERLFPNTQEFYGPAFQDHYLDQYKKYLDSLWHLSDLRQKINSYFLTINTLLLTALGFSFTRESSFISNGGQLSIPFVGVIICVIWWAIIYSYKQRGIIKQRIVHCIEERLPTSPYNVEWDIMIMKNKGLRYHFLRVSLMLPWAFVLLYLFIILFSL